MHMMMNLNAAEKELCLSVSHVCVSSYPVCVQLWLNSRHVAPYRRLLLQLLTFKLQPVQKLLQGHVEPLPRGHLWVQVGPSNIKIDIYVSFPLWKPYICTEQFQNIFIALCCRTPAFHSPHTEGLVAQVIPALAHVVQTSLKESTILRVP